MTVQPPDPPSPDPLSPDFRSPTVRLLTPEEPTAQPAPAARLASRVVALAVVATTAGAAGAGFLLAFDADDLIPELPVAAVLPAVLVGVARYRRRPVPLLLSVLGWVVGFVVWACYTVAAEAGGLRDRLELVGAGLANGPAQLVDVSLPAPADPTLIVVPLAATWLAAAVGAEIVARTGAALTAALPAVVVLVGATAVGVPASGDNLVNAAVVVAGSAVLAAVRPPSWSGRRSRPGKPARPHDVAGRLVGSSGVEPGAVASHRVGAAYTAGFGDPVERGGADVDDAGADGADDVDARIVTLFPVGGGGVGPRSVRGQRAASRDAAVPAESTSDGSDGSDGFGETGTDPSDADVVRQRRRRAGGTVVAAAVVVAVGLVAAVGLPADETPFDPRDRVVAATTDLTGLNPLSLLGGWSARPDERLFTVTYAAGPAAVAGAGSRSSRLRLAVLDAYDGSLWATTGQFVRAGSRLAGAAPDDAGGREVVQTIDVAALGGSLMPAADRPVELRPADGGTLDGESLDGGLEVDPDSGMLVAARSLTAGDRYQVVSQPPRTLTAAELTALEVAADPADGPTLAVPDDLPPVVRQLANVAAGRGATAFARAALLEDYLSSNFRFDPTAPAGQTLAHVEHFLTQTRLAGSEQFATTFALAARLLGLPTRVAVGFVAEPGDGDATVPVPVLGRDALAWPEVHFADVGWVAFFPTPAATGSEAGSGAGSVPGLGQGESAEQAAAVEAVVRAERERVPAFDTPGAESSSESSDGSGSVVAAAARWLVVLGLGLVVAVVVGYPLAVALSPWLARRRRRSAPSARAQVVGAWQSVIDTLSVAGATVPSAASPTEVVAIGVVVGGSTGATALRPLADLASTALFAPDEVFDFEGSAGPAASAEAWRLADAFDRAVRETVGLGQRTARRWSPRTVLADLRR